MPPSSTLSTQFVPVRLMPKECNFKMGRLAQRISVFLCCLVGAGVVSPGYASPASDANLKVVVFPGLGVDTLYSLPDRWVLAESIEVRVDSVLWHKGINYWVVPPDNKLRFYRIIDPSELIEVSYRVLPFELEESFYHHDLADVVTVPDTGEVQQSIPLSARLSQATTGFGSELRRSGSLVRGITIGTGQDLEIQSGLQLQIEGRVGTNIDVLAVLSDQNTPIQPEGTTQTLEEIDKAYVQVSGSNLRATLGDFELSLPGHRWASYSRKLTGARGEGWTDWGRLTVTGAVSEGEFFTNSFYGQEGNQGPYRLTAKDGRAGIRVLAGTEHVWIDGLAMERGDTRDYVVEYGNGEITFTANRLITGDSRILVDFQYAAEAYRRSYYSAQSVGEVGDSTLTVTGTFLFEGDDPSTPLGFGLTDADRQALSEAGDGVGGVWITGVDSVGRGNGVYVYADTTFADSTYRYLQWVGLDSLDQPLGYLNVFFSQQIGDSASYIRTYSPRGDLYYRWVGPGYGLYGPYRRLTTPKRHTVTDISLDYKPLQHARLSGELAVSDLDNNLYSPLDDNDNTGWAGEVTLDVLQQPLAVGDRSLGTFSTHGEYRRKDDRFSELSRSGLVEYNRYWGLQGTESPGEEVGEGTVTYQPIHGVAVSGGFGSMDRSDFHSDRKNGSVSVSFPQRFEGLFQQTWIDTRYPIFGETSSYQRQEGRVAYHRGLLHPTLFHRMEQQKTQSDTLEGTRFDENGGGMGFGTLWGMFLSADVGLREDQVIHQTYFQDHTQTWTTNAGWKGDWGASFHGEADYTHRVRYFVHSDSGDIKTDLGSLTATMSPWNGVMSSQLNYRLSNSRVAQLAVVAIHVADGQGDYIEQNGVYVPDDDGNIRLETVPTGEYQPVTDMSTGLSLKLQPERLPKATQDRLGVLPRVSTETQLDVQEQTRWPHLLDVVTYRPGVLQGDSTLYGRFSLRQDLYWDRTQTRFSARLRGRMVESLNRRYQLNSETSSQREGSLWLRRKFSPALSSEWLTSAESQNHGFTGLGRVDRDIRRQSSRVDLSYRWAQPHELGLGLGVTHGKDLASTEEFLATEVEPSFTESLRGRGRLDVSVRWSHVVSDNPSLSYELSEGLNPGDNFRWTVQVMLHLGKNLTGSATYEGRSEAGEPVRHQGRMEVRAFF
jgi:hypothetical protein